MTSPFVAGAFAVRPCTVADLRQLRATWPSSADVHDRHFARQRAGTQTLLVAWDGDRAVGSGVIRWQNPELPEISDLYPGLVEIAHARASSGAVSTTTSMTTVSSSTRSSATRIW